jgi:hypothetical protein
VALLYSEIFVCPAGNVPRPDWFQSEFTATTCDPMAHEVSVTEGTVRDALDPAATWVTLVVSAPVKTTAWRPLSVPEPDEAPVTVTVIAPPVPTPVQISAPPSVPAPPVLLALLFFRARLVHVIAVPVLVTDATDVSAPLRPFAAYMSTTSDPDGGVNDAVVTLTAVAVLASAGVEASTASATTGS